MTEMTTIAVARRGGPLTAGVSARAETSAVAVRHAAVAQRRTNISTNSVNA